MSSKYLQTFEKNFTDPSTYQSKVAPCLAILAIQSQPASIEMLQELTQQPVIEIVSQVVKPLREFIHQDDNGIALTQNELKNWLMNQEESKNFFLTDKHFQAYFQFVWNEFTHFEQSKHQDLVLQQLPPLLAPSSAGS